MMEGGVPFPLGLGAHMADRPRTPLNRSRRPSLVYSVPAADPLDPMQYFNRDCEGVKFQAQGWKDVWAAGIFFILFTGLVVVAAWCIANDRYSPPFDWSSNNADFAYPQEHKLFSLSAESGISGSRWDVQEVSSNATSFGICEINADCRVNDQWWECVAGVCSKCRLPWSARLTREVFAILSVTICLSASLALVWLAVLSAFATKIIAVMAVLCAGSLGLQALLLGLVVRVEAAAVPCAVFVVLAVVLRSLRQKATFSALIFQQAMGTVRRHPTTVAVTVLFFVVYGIAFTLWIWLLMSTKHQWQIYPLLFCGFYIGQVLQTIPHTVTAAVAGTLFFASSAPPPFPTLKSLRRALTTSLGSICMGALFVAPMRLIRSLSNILRKCCAGCCAACLTGCMKYSVDWATHYAYVHIAIYGKGFRDSGASTARRIRDSGLEPVISDLIVGELLILAALISSLFVGTSTGAVLWYLYRHKWLCSLDVAWAVLWGVVAFFISYFVHQMFFTVVDACLSTFFVAYAQEPFVLYRNHHTLFTQLRTRQGIQLDAPFSGVVLRTVDFFQPTSASQDVAGPPLPPGESDHAVLDLGALGANITEFLVEPIIGLPPAPTPSPSPESGAVPQPRNQDEP
eukprot:TRINITY_DN7275_c0_g1_i1.p1 TRINITY_DN7275_c0_g1~~TRINITY_DN7275_c0_g1_i1.p1  ORF type:complete len:627 (-),score=60.17 TRINITY_DN7275_c0_g1_i1:183-2063(-)